MRRAIAAVACVLLAGGVAGGEDVSAPTWRGEDKTLYAKWDTWGADWDQYVVVTEEPDEWSSNPSLTEAPYYYLDPDGGTIWQAADGRNDILQVSDDGMFWLYLPNFPGGPLKEVQVQVTYYTDDNWNPVVIPYVVPSTGELKALSLVDFVEHADGWVTDIWSASLEPNPGYEYIDFYAVDYATTQQKWYPAYIDQVVVDTQCVPEPAALALLAAGALAALLRRRRVPAARP